MTHEFLTALLRVNLVGGATVLAVLALRLPLRRLFGPQIAYRLWLAPPLAAAATLMPARVVADAPVHAGLAPAVIEAGPLLVAVWLLGVLAVAAGLWRAQARFLAEARAGRAGPSVVGVIVPRIVMPADDGRYSPEERALIRAHEREHVARRDPRAAAQAAAFQAICWFNPLVHLAAHLLRLDQELACDAAVLRRHPRSRALYARTLLKTQLATATLPFGCHWPARGPHPLEVRIGLLKQARVYNGLTGPLLVAAGLVTAAVTAWSAQPPIPHPPAMVELWESQQPPSMSVMLISIPRASTPDAGP